jgi:signal transduction histidine kinase/CheY-like chemotaxis protein
MAESEEELVVLIEDEGAAAAPHLPAASWKIAVIDDDPAVHDGTRFSLFDYTLAGQGLEILSAFSAQEGRELLRAHPDIAVVLLDVVMETEAAGLELVRFIREVLKNETVRIVLRTGQPGQAPERRVIVDYDINDYKAKTELTADKLFTSLTAALRSYQQLQRLVETRRGLEIIIEAASMMFDLKSMQLLAEGVLTQLASLLNVECAGILVFRESGEGEEEFSVLAGSGCYRAFAGAEGRSRLADDLLAFVRHAFERRCHDFAEHRSILYIRTGSGREVVVLLESTKDLSDTDRALVEVFCTRLSVAFDNVILYSQLQDANQRLEERVAKRTAELTAANQRLAIQSGELRRGNRYKAELLGTIAHDLKNPLGVIMGRAEMLADLLGLDPVPAQQTRIQVEHVRTTAKRLTGMVDTLIADAMNDALDIAIRHAPIDFAALVSEVVEANRPLAERKRQSLTMRAPDSLIAHADHDRLYEAIDNVISNAIKYSPQASTIAVEASRDEGDVVVVVRDSGPGLSPEDLSRLFGRFQRLSAKPTAGESSTGLGLSTAKRIVDLHGGRVRGENNDPGPGATFTIAIPAEKRAPAS